MSDARRSNDSWVVGADAAGQRLDKFLADGDRAGSRGRALAALERGKVLVNESDVTGADAARRMVEGDAVRLWIDRPGSAKARPRAASIGDVRIVYEDADVLVVNKPPGLLSVPLERRADAPSVFDAIEDHFRSRGKRRPLVVHRIDRDTSGLVVFAANLKAQAHLREQFRRREPERVYWAVVYGVPVPSAGTWTDYLVWDRRALIQKETSASDPRAAEAMCAYRVLEQFRETSLVEVRLRTGKRNQIRIQARLRGHTLVGERRYVFGPDALRTISFERQALHARRLAFRHPADGRPMMFEADPPRDFAALLDRLRARRR